MNRLKQLEIEKNKLEKSIYTCDDAIRPIAFKSSTNESILDLNLEDEY